MKCTSIVICQCNNPYRDVPLPVDEPGVWQDVPLDVWDEAPLYEDISEEYTDFTDLPADFAAISSGAPAGRAIKGPSLGSSFTPGTAVQNKRSGQ